MRYHVDVHDVRTSTIIFLLPCQRYKETKVLQTLESKVPSVLGHSHMSPKTKDTEITEQEIKTYFKVLSSMLCEDAFANYQKWLPKVEKDPIPSGMEYLRGLRQKLTVMHDIKMKIKIQNLITQLEGILKGDTTMYQYPAKTQKEAIMFLISNAILSGGGLGVIESEEPRIDQIAESIKD